MKRWSVLLCALLLAFAAGCGKVPAPSSGRPTESPAASSSAPAEPPVSSCEPADSPSASEPEKVLLELLWRPYLYTEQAEPVFTAADIPCAVLTELADEPYAGSPELQPFADYARDRLGLALDSRWLVFVHYYDEDKTVGMVQFRYCIGDGAIGTNKSILFTLNQGRADGVYASYLDREADETALLARVADFQSRYVQERYTLKPGEQFESETTDYTYYYNTGVLAYCYNVFFSYDIGVINNDYGTVCLIDENGEAVLPGIDY